MKMTPHQKTAAACSALEQDVDNLAEALAEQTQRANHHEERVSEALQLLRDIGEWLGPLQADSPDSLSRMVERIRAALGEEK